MFVASGRLKRGVFLLIMLFLPLSCFAMDAPDTITIDALASYYEPVQFDHELHVGIAEDCSACHHHTTGTGTNNSHCARCHSNEEEQDLVSCQDCHQADSFTAQALSAKSEKNLYHVDATGLKGAYHQNCIGCHQDMDGPSGCTDCHARTEEGDKFFYSGQFAPPAGEGSSH